jgi:hypothetical protein
MVSDNACSEPLLEYMLSVVGQSSRGISPKHELSRFCLLYGQAEGFSAECCSSSSAVALHRSPPALLVDSDQAALALQSAGNRVRCLYVRFFRDALAEQAETGEPASEVQAR